MKIFDVINYNPLTGVITWTVDVSSKCRAGMVAGTVGDDGYIRIGYKGRYHKAHRLGWEIHNGPIPKGFFIDHKDRIRCNNGLDNLRLAARQQNNQNSNDRKRKSGLPRNIRQLKAGYQVVVKINKQKVRFGVYQDLELAVLVENEVRSKYHDDFVCDI